MHMPATARLFPPAVAGPILLALQLVTLTALCRLIKSPAAIYLGAISGLLAAAMSLIMIGSNLAPKAASTADLAGSSWIPTPNTAAMAAGWLALGAVTGLLAGALSRLGNQPPALTSAAPPEGSPQQWLARLALAALAATFPLLIAGGLVTSSQSGMAVPDWPGTYGANMFLYPVALMADPRIFLEHTHRLLGALVGLATLIAAGYTFAVDRRSAVRSLAAGLVLLVIAQGLLGALRVIENKLILGFIHGVTAQIFFAGLAVLAVLVRPSAKLPIHPSSLLPARVRLLHAVLLGALFMQLVMGALSRHLASDHAKWSHVAFSLIVVVIAVIAGSGWLGRFRRGELPPHVAPALRRLGIALHAVVTLQFLLGWVALWAVLVYDPNPKAIPTFDQLADTPVMELAPTILRTVHQANGALLLALAAASAAWAWVLSRPARSEATLPR